MGMQELRKRIDQYDGKIVKLLNQRADAAQRIGKLKAKSKKSVYAASREQEVLTRIKKLNGGPLSEQALDAIYREVMSASLSLEKDIKIAYLGPEASFTHSAALQKFGSQIEYVSSANISNVFHQVENDDCDYGVVPIENSIEGAVTNTFDLLADSDLQICAHIVSDISHNLLSHTSLSKIKKVYSKPEALGQCRYWVQEHLPQAELIDTSSTTRAAQIAAKEKTSAAIASLLAAKVYGLNVVRRGIEDVTNNVTRFLVIAKSDSRLTGKDRTSILFSIRDKVGALHAMLTPFDKEKINLMKIESRPSKKKAWDYYFFVDFEGHRQDKKVQRALNQLDGMCKYLKVLGSYPQ